MVVAKVTGGVGMNGEGMVNKLYLKYLEFEVLLGHSGRTIRMIPDYRVMKLKRNVQTKL